MKKMYSLIFLLICLFNFSLAERHKVIFDCDLGGDIDDAFAVALLLCSQEEVEILGFCMDHGNTPGRAVIACKMLYETGLDSIPVFMGRHTPTVVGVDTALAGNGPQYEWAKGFDLLKPQEKPAVDFMIEALNQYPGEVTIFTVGPVVNIGDIVDKDPHVLKKSKQIISMFGSFEKGYGHGKPSREWNVRGSIEDARKYIDCGANIILAGLDITDHVIFSDQYLTALAMRDTPLTNAIGVLYSLWYHHADWAVLPKMFDGVAIGMLLWPELFETRDAHIYIDDQGYTKIDETKEPNCKIGITIKKDVFLARMFRKLMDQDFKRD